MCSAIFLYGKTSFIHFDSGQKPHKNTHIANGTWYTQYGRLSFWHPHIHIFIVEQEKKREWKTSFTLFEFVCLDTMEYHWFSVGN